MKPIKSKLQKTTHIPSMGTAHQGGTPYNQISINNQFDINKPIQGHTQQSNMAIPDQLKRFLK